MQRNSPYPFGTPRDKIIVPLDNISTIDDAHRIIHQTAEYVGWYKVGLEAIIAFGSETMINLIKKHGKKGFLDGKFLDIPNTTGNAAGKVAQQKADMMDVHCSNGIVAMKAATEKNTTSIILGITVLTSFSEEECHHIYGGSVNETVLKFAYDAKEAGLDGIVCSAKDLDILSGHSELNSLFKITPGIQPVSMASNDQKRTMTPAEAIKLRADALVIGRAITESKDPGEAARIIMEEIGEAMVAA